MNNHTDIEWVDIRVPTPDGGDEFQLSRVPLTVAQVRRFLEAGGYRDDSLWTEAGRRWRDENRIARPFYWGQPGYDKPDLPATGLSFHEAIAIARFFGANLPDEASWLAAATNGGKNRYPWGDDGAEIASTRANLSFFGTYRPSGLTEVSQFPAGRTVPGGVVAEPGLLDLLGNVSEWCVRGDDPAAPGAAVLRGGCSWHDPQTIDAHFFDRVNPEVRDNQTGLRLMRRKAPAPAASEAAPVAPPRPRKPIARPTRPFRQEGIPPGLDDGTWRLVVDGEVARPLSLTLEELKARFPRVRRQGLYVCVCRWGSIDEVAGLAVRDVIAAAGPLAPAGELFVVQQSVPGSPDGKVYETSVSLADLVEHEAMLCDELDGRPLTPELGYPLRLIDFHIYGYKQVKCLARLHVARRFVPGWWEEQCGYDPVGLVQPGTITVVGQAPYRKQIGRPGLVPFP